MSRVAISSTRVSEIDSRKILASTISVDTSYTKTTLVRRMSLSHTRAIEPRATTVIIVRVVGNLQGIREADLLQIDKVVLAGTVLTVTRIITRITITMVTITRSMNLTITGLVLTVLTWLRIVGAIIIIITTQVVEGTCTTASSATGR